MGVENFYYTKMIDVMKNHINNKEDKKVLCLGYPDMLLDEQFMVSIYGSDFVAKIPEDSNADNIRAWHKRELPKIYDAMFLLKHHGFDVTVFDSIAHRGYEKIVDLNEPLPEEYKQQFDLIIDTGTLEHCFNVGQAFKNVCQSVKIGGVFMTAAPMTKLNHGYWNFGTIVHQDGFSQNGFEILDTTHYHRGSVLPPESCNSKRIPLKTITTCIAKKVNEQPWTWPIQGKYK
jgi:hypothetical protein